MPRRKHLSSSSRPAIRRQARVHINPPQISSNVSYGHTFRFVSTSSTATSITPSSLLLAAGAFTSATNTSVVSLCTSVRVNRIEMWSPPASQGASATCSVNFTGTTPQQPDREFSDTTVSTAIPAHVNCKPGPRSLASFWQSASANTLFTLVAPVGTIIDVHIGLYMNDGGDAAPASVGVATAALGNFYYLSLDPNATHRYTPVSLATTT